MFVVIRQETRPSVDVPFYVLQPGIMATYIGQIMAANQLTRWESFTPNNLSRITTIIAPDVATFKLFSDDMQIRGGFFTKRSEYNVANKITAKKMASEYFP